MNVNELRFGSLVEYKGSIHTVEFLQYSMDETEFECVFRKEDQFSSAKLNDVTPIPLTEEILIINLMASRVGGKVYLLPMTVADISLTKQYTLFPDKEWTIAIQGFDGKIILHTKVLYLHHLQNLYFALTGEELPVKEPVK